MALSKASLKTDLLAMLQDARADKTPEDVADQLATAIDSYVRSAVVTTIVNTPDTINGTGTGALS